MTTQSNKKSVWGWYFYDWAAQPYHTLLITFFFAPYFTDFVAVNKEVGTAYWSLMLTVTGISIALAAPVLGAISDTTGPRKPWIFLFSIFYIVGAAGLWFAVPDMSSVFWILISFSIGLIGVELSQIFVNGILPTLGSREDLGRISGSGWAFGYLGGFFALILAILFVVVLSEGKTIIGQDPILGLDPALGEDKRALGPLTALWYFIFVLPFFFWVPDVERRKRAAGAVTQALRALGNTLRTLPRQRSFAVYLASSMFYRDALNGLYSFGGIYATGVLGWEIGQLGVYGIVSIAAGALFCWLGGYLDKWMGPKFVVVLSISVLIGVCVLIAGTGRDAVFGVTLVEGSNLPDILFMICGASIGAAGGTIQAASRTLLVHQVKDDRLTEAFGLYALSGRATTFIAPMFIGIGVLVTGSQRFGISLPIIVLFAIGLILLKWVDTSKE
ncbi:MFS transporter [Roseobacter sp. N2S]|uniref:MFS transporter n=1 Tax=Roseobacter sp. N2S TaxID=2663844 RepID=UPI002861C74D|nr:MFS transporter [Roseobacter sp. N2S]MDR6263432.1 UMF1 family MFS transporter [Roseobacter sp. N2S]